MVYRDAGGLSPVLLLHDEDHGGALIDALARHGDGLPANVLPLAVNEVTQIGLEAIAASFAYGAAAVRVVLRARPLHDLAGLHQTIALGAAVLAGLGFAGERVATIETDDPFALGDALRAAELAEPVARPASFEPIGGRRDVLRSALRGLYRVAAAVEGRHWMYQNAPDRLDLIRMCEDCRVIAVTEAGFDPHAAPERPRVRTTDDYLRERDRKRDT